MRKTSRNLCACAIGMYATVVPSILFITLIIRCTDDTRESRTRRALSAVPLTTDDHLQALGVAEATHGNWQMTHGNLYRATHGNFPFILLPFSTKGCLRMGHSLCITPRTLAHAPVSLVSDLHGRLQHNVSRHENGRKSSDLVEIVLRKFGALSDPRHYPLTALSTLHQTNPFFSAPSARPENMRVSTCEVFENGLLDM